MPNWCQNTVYVEAPQSEIEAIIAATKAEESNLLQYLHPMPDMPEDNGTLPAWYSWRVENWGTKWDVDAEIISSGEGWLNLVFDSAWGPPVEAFQAWVAKDLENHNFNLRYAELGMMFCGEAGNDFCDHYSIPETAAEAKEMLPVELLEEFDLISLLEEWEREEAENFQD